MSENNIDISIIVPIYNAEQYITKFIENINQSVNMPIIEVIFIDDGSTDESVKTVESLNISDFTVRLFKQKHQKQAVARNLGINHSQGTYIMFLDIDDSFNDHFLRIMFDSIKSYDLTVCGIYRCIGNQKIDLSESILKDATSNQDLVKKYVINRLEMDSGLWNKLFDKSIIVENNLKFVNDNFLEDTLFVLNYLVHIMYNKINYIEQPLYNYVKNTMTTTTTFQSNMDILCDNYVEYVYKLTKDIFTDEQHINLMYSVKARSYTYVMNRHILDDPKWNSKMQKEFIDSHLSGIKGPYISFKYRIGLFIAKLIPKTYIYLYKKFKENH